MIVVVAAAKNFTQYIIDAFPLCRMIVTMAWCLMFLALTLSWSAFQVMIIVFQSYTLILLESEYCCAG